MNAVELKEIRKKQGLTMDGFAKLIGCPFQTYWRWEHDKNKISKIYQHRIEDVLIKSNNNHSIAQQLQ